MPALTIKNIPEPLYQQLKTTASAHHRSINGELLYQLEAMLLPQPINATSYIEQVRLLRKQVTPDQINPEDIQQAIHAGRA